MGTNENTERNRIRILSLQELEDNVGRDNYERAEKFVDANALKQIDYYSVLYKRQYRTADTMENLVLRLEQIMDEEE